MKVSLKPSNLNMFDMISDC